MDPESINSFVEKFLSANDTLHFLVNNAGIMWVPLQRDMRGCTPKEYANEVENNVKGGKL